MAKVKIHVWHDASGQIIAVGQPMLGQDKNLRVTPLTGEGQLVLETEIEEAKMKNLHQTHVVDVQKKVLVKIKSDA
jgi:hypothetical protein